MKDNPETTPEDNFQTHSFDQTEPFSTMDRTVGFGEQQSIQRKSYNMANQPSSTPTSPVAAEAIESEQTPAQTLDPQPQDRTIAPPPQPVARPWRLQHYLAIGLVILTLVILVLLLVMLVSKNRWASSSPPINADGVLKRQNERIAALDAKILEQLKRFDKI
jgi:hypothetical protein